jgi:Na+/phosphate symporter
MAHVDALSRAPVDNEEVLLDNALVERHEVCILMSKEERIVMCQVADEKLKRIKRMVEEHNY